MHESWIKPELMDSDEEREFYAWLLEAEYVGLITDIEYQPGSLSLSSRKSIQIEKKLKTKTKTIEKFLLHPHEYTPDFVFEWTGQDNPFIAGRRTWVDVKGTFNGHGDLKQFTINQKWVFEKYGIYINKVVPERLFKTTWVPESCRYTKVRKDFIKKYEECLIIDEFMGKRAEQEKRTAPLSNKSISNSKQTDLEPYECMDRTLNGSKTVSETI